MAADRGGAALGCVAMASRLELLEALNQLLDAWDPIGVLQVGNERESAAVDEYRSYATGIDLCSNR